MKKGKSNIAGENTKNNSLPSEKIRSTAKPERELPFKKTLYGYDPEEVAVYIDEMSATFESSSRIHESKLSSLKEELLLSNRERDSYSEKYKECKLQLDTLMKSGEFPQAEDKSTEYEAAIAKLRKKLELAESENANLRQAAQANNETKVLEYTDRIAALENEKTQLVLNAQTLRQENSELLAVSRKYDNLFSSYNEVYSQLELVKAQLAAKNEELSGVNEALEEKTTELNTVYAENEDVKKANAELEVKNGVLEKRIAENDEEINRLKEANKAQSFEYAEKTSALENEHAKNKLEMQKELKLHGCYIEQAQLTLEELSKQMLQIKQSLESIQ